MKRAILLAVCPVLAGWTSNPSALNPAGPAASAIAHLTWLLVAVLGIIYVLTLIVLGWVTVRAWRFRDLPASLAPSQERMLGRWVAGGAIASTLILTILVVLSYMTDRKLLSLERDPAVEITLSAHQWWWEITYSDPVPAKTLVTANELHLPVGKAAKITLMSSDVIHSLWLPNVNGKRDILPGHTETIWLTATKAGEWRGRCAEFCGLEHARMQLDVHASGSDLADLYYLTQLALPNTRRTT